MSKTMQEGHYVKRKHWVVDRLPAISHWIQLQMVDYALGRIDIPAFVISDLEPEC